MSMHFPSFPGVARLVQLLTGFFVRITGDTMTGPLIIQGPTGVIQTDLRVWDANDASFDVQGNTAIVVLTREAVSTAGVRVDGQRGRGATLGAPDFLTTNDDIISMRGLPWNGTSYSQQGSYLYEASEAHSAVALGTRLLIFTTPNGSTTITDTVRMQAGVGIQMQGTFTIIDWDRVWRNRIFTVGTLPAGVNGMRTFVSNALAPAFGAAVVGGGAVIIPVYYAGAWNVG